MALALPPRPWIVGHRGAAGEAPENTLASVHLAVAQGADMIEVDVQRAADGALVAAHDETLERMGGLDLAVEGTPSARLLASDVSGGLPASERTRVPLLEDLLGGAPAEIPFNVELKRRRADLEALAEAVVRDLADRDGVLVSSFDHELLAVLRAATLELPLAPLGRRDPDALLGAADELDAWSVHCHHRLASRDLVVAAGARPVLVYTVDDAATAARLFEFGVAGVFTNHPGRLRSDLRERPA